MSATPACLGLWTRRIGLPETDRGVIESYGYNTDTTPIDVLMNGPDDMHHKVAWAMANDEEHPDG